MLNNSPLDPIHIDTLIIGAGLTGLCCAHHLHKEGHSFRLLEKTDRVGGVIRSIQTDDFLFETGPNTGVVSNQELLDLFDDLQGLCTFTPARPEAQIRLILKKGKWHALPSSLLSAIKTPLFSWKDKLSILAEPFRKKGDDALESIASMVSRRLGSSILDYAIDPFIGGIYAGNTEELVVKYALPKLYALEQSYGSFIKGAIAKKKAAKRSKEKPLNKEVFSIEGGLEQLPKALSQAIQAQILLDCKEIRIERLTKGDFLVRCKQGHFLAKHIITTTGAYELPKLLSFLPSPLLQNLSKLTYAPVVSVSIGFKHWPGTALKGFGGLIPSKEKRPCLGILFLSSFLTHRAPSQGCLFTIYLGGTRHPDIIQWDDQQIVALVEQEVKVLFHLPRFHPDLLSIHRHQHAIAQYSRSTVDRIAAIGEVEKNYPGLFLGGNIQGGVGIADRVKQGKELAQKILNHTREATKG